MDPTANLTEQLELARSIQSDVDNGREVDAHDAARLAELVLNLHEWMRSGAMLPDHWNVGWVMVD